MTEEEKVEFHARMDAAKAAKKAAPAAAAPAHAGTSARTATRSGRTQHETDLEKRLSVMEDENHSLKTSKSALEKFIEKLTRPPRSASPSKAKAAAPANDGWNDFATNPW